MQRVPLKFIEGAAAETTTTVKPRLNRKEKFIDRDLF